MPDTIDLTVLIFNIYETVFSVGVGAENDIDKVQEEDDT